MKYLIILLFVIIVSSCNDTGTQTYIIPNEAAETVVELNPNASNQKFIYVSPKHWIEQAPSSMVLVSFQISNNSKQATLTVLKFPGQTGGLLQNVNRWANQLGLSNYTLYDLNKLVTSGNFDNYQYELVNLTNDKTNQSIIVYIIRNGNFSWFFKMMGSESVIQKELNNFSMFMKSIRLP